MYGSCEINVNGHSIFDALNVLCVYRVIEQGIDAINNLRRDKWEVDGKLRK